MLNGKISYSDVSTTTGSEQYAGMYYANATIPSNVGELIGLTVISATSNRPAEVIRIGATSIRVYSGVSGTAVTVRALFMK